jgi:HEAT repeat protein
MVQCLLSSTGKASRKCLLNALTGGKRVSLALLVPHLGDSRWYVVRNMVFLLGQLKEPAAGEHLEQALRHQDERVRREAVRSLAATGTERATSLVLACLEDPASSVRATAARQAPVLTGADVTAAILRRINARDFSGRPSSETLSFLDALGRMKDDRAVPTLDGIWRSRGLFRAKPLPLRLAALTSLGQIRSPAALASLSSAGASPETPIREHARKLLSQPDQSPCS